MNGSLTVPILTEDVAQAVRRGDLAEVARLSPLLACLLELLKLLGVKRWEAPLLEGLPHHAERIDIVDLRNLLVHLGYLSHERRVRRRRLPDARLLPALLLGDGGEVLLLRARTGDRFEWYDGRSRQEGGGALPPKGRLFVLDRVHRDGQHAEAHTQGRWFAALTRRFSALFLHLVTMTFWLNLTTVAVPLFIMAVYDQVIGIHAMTSLP